MRSCVNCKYSRDIGAYLACYGQKNAPRVDWDYVCESWKPEYATNADRLRAMTIEEKTEFLAQLSPSFIHETVKAAWLDWLKQEADDGD